MIQLFDLHADIGFDVMQKRKDQRKDILKDHIKKWRTSNTEFVGMASYFEGSESWEQMQEMVLALKEEILKESELTLVLKKEDLYQKGTIKALLTIEGMCGIKMDAADKIQWLYDQGVRIASFCWNDENALATGVRGSENRGLTVMGMEALEKMLELNMVIDVSHANVSTFNDIMKYASKNVIATHSNARALCNHPRNLLDEQLLMLKKVNGLVGVVGAPLFVDEQEEKQDIEHLVKHVLYLKELIGIDHIAFGFDFMDFFPVEEHATAAPTGKRALDHFEDASQAQSIIQALKQVLTKSEIEQIAYKNALHYLEKIYE